MNGHEDEDRTVAFQHAVARLATVPGFMAHRLAEAFGGDVSPQRVASELGCSEETALRLALMTEPSVERQEFRRGIAEIVKDTGIDPGRLMNVIRQGRALAAYSAPGPGTLLAARDRLPDEEDE